MIGSNIIFFTLCTIKYIKNYNLQTFKKFINAHLRGWLGHPRHFAIAYGSTPKAINNQKRTHSLMSTKISRTSMEQILHFIYQLTMILNEYK